MSDLLSMAFKNLEDSVSSLDLARSIDGPHSESAARALHAFYRREREFNHQLSLVLKEGGEIPIAAYEALDLQRFNGFHGRGTAKIISVHSQR